MPARLTLRPEPPPFAPLSRFGGRDRSALGRTAVDSPPTWDFGPAARLDVGDGPEEADRRASGADSFVPGSVRRAPRPGPRAPASAARER